MVGYLVGVFFIVSGVWLIYDTNKNKEDGILGGNFDVGYFMKGTVGVLFGIVMIIIKLLQDLSP